MIMSRRILLKMTNVSEKSIEKNITHLVFKNCFSEKRTIYEII